jgi:phosphoribosylformylglycinamidine cyclo-ligase
VKSGLSNNRKPITYRSAGVDIDAGDEAVERMKPRVRATYGPRVMADWGGFAGAFRLDYDEKLFKRNYRDPVLLACTDGVGSKILLAIAAKRYDTIGIDLVAMNVNDLLTSGAEPLFVLDYIAAHRVDPAVIAEIVGGIAAGCEKSGAALLGGETAEMPDLYRPGDFDLAAFAVGVAERGRMLSNRNVKPGDQIVGLASSGIHSNGYALVRKVLLESAGLDLNQTIHSLGEPLIDALLRPTEIYVRPVLDVLNRYSSRVMVKGMAHITGGGLPGNLPRLAPDDCDIVLRAGSWPVPPIFGLIEHHGVDEEEMYRVFNMGIGYALAVRPVSVAAVIRSFEKSGVEAHLIGRVRRGAGRVEIR